MYDQDEQRRDDDDRDAGNEELHAERVDGAEVTNSEERNWALLTHAASFIGWVFPFANILGPLILWLMKREESALVDRHGKASLNFQISLTIWGILCIPLLFILIGFLLLLILVIVNIVYTIINMIKASNGEEPAYPLSITIIK
jgi:uncharacterized Tic20 family protein